LQSKIFKMRTKRDFSIAFKGLKAGVHQFDYEIDDKFFSAFENSLVKSGKLQIEIDFHKRIDHFQIDINIYGTIATTCDRCTSDIDLPLEKEAQYIVKFSEDEIDDKEVIYISPKAQVLDMSEYIYEVVILGIPLIKTYDCDQDQPSPCNQKVLEYLNDSDDESSKSKTNPMWDKLNDLKFNDN